MYVFVIILASIILDFATFNFSTFQYLFHFSTLFYFVYWFTTIFNLYSLYFIIVNFFLFKKNFFIECKTLRK